ncbi:hypothetical protein GCM10025857_59650 [Alicyclobacillus contaminans]|nr:hypothetical protein GCM10025857_59650 [Alicyclobacillus contaminans]
METITNFRELGGLKNRQGEVIAKNKLLRSGELTHVSSQEQNKLLENYRLGKSLIYVPLKKLRNDQMKNLKRHNTNILIFLKMSRGKERVLMILKKLIPLRWLVIICMKLIEPWQLTPVPKMASKK